MNNLFDPITLRGLTIKNRVWVSPMCQYSAIDGVVGDWHMAPIKPVPGYQEPFAQAIKVESDIAVAAVGAITDPHQAQEIINSNKADAVFLARAMIRNPRWAMAAAEELKVMIDWPKPLERGRTFRE